MANGRSRGYDGAATGAEGIGSFGMGFSVRGFFFGGASAPSFVAGASFTGASFTAAAPASLDAPLTDTSAGFGRSTRTNFRMDGVFFIADFDTLDDMEAVSVGAAGGNPDAEAGRSRRNESIESRRIEASVAAGG